MDASDLIKALQNTLRGGGRPHMDPGLCGRTEEADPHLRMSNGSWRVDETYVKIKDYWIYLY
jgi:transposase-like protein